MRGDARKILGADGMVYVTEAAGARLTKVNLTEGDKTRLVGGRVAQEWPKNEKRGALGLS